MAKWRYCAEEEWEEESSRRTGREGAQAVEGANGNGRGCAEEGWEEESSRRSGREGAQAVEGANWKRERLCRGRMGRGEQ